MNNINEKLKVSIGELAFGVWDVLTVEHCCTCDAKFPTLVPYDPGHPYHQVVTAILCNECSEKSNADLIPIHEFSELNEIDSYRASAGLRPFLEVNEEFGKEDFDSYLRMEGKFGEWHLNNGELKDKTLQQLEGMHEHLFGERYDRPKSREKLIHVIGVELYGEEVTGEDVLQNDPDYYDPHRDLMIQRYRELGSNYYS